LRWAREQCWKALALPRLHGPFVFAAWVFQNANRRRIHRTPQFSLLFLRVWRLMPPRLAAVAVALDHWTLFKEAVDDWRRLWPDLPSCPEAIRQLVRQALKQAIEIRFPFACRIHVAWSCR
jgi:hypothetical protein